uniref:Nebulette n=1 Tax=Fundulus heteroclitus TaxID=8078 RepID=A0A3Q2SU50_FUNHE
DPNIQRNHLKDKTQSQNVFELYLFVQAKYKEAGKKQSSSCLYALLPATLETQHAKESAELLSEVRASSRLKGCGHLLCSYIISSPDRKYKEAVKNDLSCSLYHQLPETLEMVHAKEVSQMLSEKFYKEKYNREKGKSDYASMKTLPQVEHAMEVNRKQSEVGYRTAKEELHHYNSQPDRPDILKKSLQHFNVSLSFILQVKYKTNQNQRPEGSSDVPNLLQLEHALHASKLQSNLEYKKKSDQTKAHYHMAVDTAEQLHHRENAVLHSQVKYKEEYEKNKGRSLMEFGETQSYKVSREAQKMQSEREYRRDFEEQVRGKALLDVDQTPAYLTARHASSLLSEKEYRRDLETEIVGKGMELSADVLEIQRAQRASAIQSQVPRNTENNWVCVSLLWARPLRCDPGPLVALRMI